MKKLIMLCSFGLLGTFAMASNEIVQPEAGCRVVNGYYNDEGEVVITHDIEIEGMSCAEFWAMIKAIMDNL